LALMNRSFAKRMQGPAKRAQERIGEVSAVAHESIDGALVVKTLGREPAEVARLAAKAEAVRIERTEAGRIRAAFEPALESLPSGASIALLAIGAWRLSTGDVTLGTLVQVVALFDLIAWPLRFIGWILLELPRAVVAHDRIAEVLAERSPLERPAAPARLPEGPLEVRCEAVTYGFDGFRVLDGISFTVAPNESVAVVGATGVGKSTLAQLLVRLDDPSSGEIILGGVNLRHVEDRELRRAAAIVFQESFLFASTVTENIKLDTDASEDDVRRAAEIVRASVRSTRTASALPASRATSARSRPSVLTTSAPSIDSCATADTSPMRSCARRAGPCIFFAKVRFMIASAGTIAAPTRARYGSASTSETSAKTTNRRAPIEKGIG
ncbi:MAG TPA: ABC transporter ATP-binding protein, partial [Actinomycetota bacterium]|nr:ABC transporter ATP-binding protein [Actinomycetota bacterium]